MEYKRFGGFEKIYPEKLYGTDKWFYGLHPWVDIEDVPALEGSFPGTRLYLFSINGEVYEPFEQVKNVYIGVPVYSNLSESFGVMRADFECGTIQLWEWQPCGEKSMLSEIPLSDCEDLINVRVAKYPFCIVREDIPEDTLTVLCPFRRTYELERNETLDLFDEDRMITSKWIEDPDYREEILFRRISDGAIIRREKGYMAEMPDGTFWMMTEQ